MTKDMGVVLSKMDGGTEIVLNGAYRFQWRLTTGGAPHVGFFPVDERQDDILRASNPFTSRWKLTFKFRGETVEFRDLFLKSRGRVVNGSHVTWHVVDRRYVVQNAYIDTDFNKLRTQNGFIRNSGALTNPALTPYQQVRKESFVGYTMMAASGLSFSNGVDPDNSEPWTAYRALLHILSGRYYDELYRNAAGNEISTTDTDRQVVAAESYGIFAPDGVGFRFNDVFIADGVVDNGYILKNWNPRGTFRKAVNTLERLAHVVTFLLPDGRFGIAPADPDLANRVLKRYGWYEQAGGIPNVQYKHPEAPKVYRRYFTTRREHRVEYDEWFDRTQVHPDPDLVSNANPAIFGGPTGLYDTRAFENTPEDSLFLEPVFRLPQDTTSFQKGQWAGVQDSFDEWNADTRANPPRKILTKFPRPFSHNTLHTLPPWAGPALASEFLRDRDRIGFRNPVLEARISTMYNYRKYWRIPEITLDSIQNWDFQLASIFSTSTRSRQVSPVWCDYLAWDSVIDRPTRALANVSGDDPGYGHIRNVPILNPFTNLNTERAVSEIALRPALYSVFDIYSTDDRTSPSPFELSAVSNARGVFELSSNPDLEGQVHSRYLGLFDPNTVASRDIGGLNAYGNVIVSQVKWTPIFRFFTIISIVWRSPNHARKSYYQEVDGSTILTGAVGPLYESFYHGYEAYQTYEDTVDGRAKFRFADGTGQLFVDHPGEIGNEDVLTEITRSEAYQHYFRFRPVILGTYRSPGVSVLHPTGQIQSTGVNAQNGRVESFLSAEVPPRVPDAVAGLAPDVKDVIQRLPEGTSE